MEEDVRARLKAAATVLVSSALALGLAEGALRLRERGRAPAAKSGLDYGDTLRGDGLGPGGFLKEGFEGRVVNGLGGTVFWLDRSGARFHTSVVILGLTLGNDIAQAGLVLDSPGGYRIEPPAFSIEQTAVGLALEKRDEIHAMIPEACLAGAPAEVPVRRRLHVLDLAFGMPAQPIGSSRSPGLSRFLLDGVNGLGICLVPPPPLVDVLFERLSRTLLGYRALANERGFAFAVVLFPQRYAMQEEDWNADGHRAVFEALREGVRALAYGKIPSSR